MLKIWRAIDAEPVVYAVSRATTIRGAIQIVTVIEKLKTAIVRVDDIAFHITSWLGILNDNRPEARCLCRCISRRNYANKTGQKEESYEWSKSQIS
jgi:hypothetical protein